MNSLSGGLPTFTSAVLPLVCFNSYHLQLYSLSCTSIVCSPPPLTQTNTNNAKHTNTHRNTSVSLQKMCVCTFVAEIVWAPSNKELAWIEGKWRGWSRNRHNYITGIGAGFAWSLLMHLFKTWRRKENNHWLCYFQGWLIRAPFNSPPRQRQDEEMHRAPVHFLIHLSESSLKSSCRIAISVVHVLKKTLSGSPFWMWCAGVWDVVDLTFGEWLQVSTRPQVGELWSQSNKSVPVALQGLTSLLWKWIQKQNIQTGHFSLIEIPGP